jgi:AcrR family transcriptional regulator
MTGRSRTRLDPDVRRDQILAAAAELFRRSEYSSVPLAEVAQRAGVTRGLVHHYFGSKRGLYLAVVERSVRIPADVRLIPPGATGDFDEIVGACVRSWMQLIRTVGGLWSGLADSGGGDDELDAIVDAARDELVERMIDELPFPTGTDPALLRPVLRSYAALARVASTEWLVRRTLDSATTEALLRTSLLSLVEHVLPEMAAARDRGPGRTAH